MFTDIEALQLCLSASKARPIKCYYDGGCKNNKSLFTKRKKSDNAVVIYLAACNCTVMVLYSALIENRIRVNETFLFDV